MSRDRRAHRPAAPYKVGLMVLVPLRKVLGLGLALTVACGADSRADHDAEVRDAVVTDIPADTVITDATPTDASAGDVHVESGPAGFTPSTIEVQPWPEANAHFGYAEEDWLGGDAAYSIPLANNRILWMFGDSFVATSDKHVRSESRFIRNSIALADGLDPTTSAVDYMWKGSAAQSSAFFEAPEVDHWAWPGHGAQLADGKLLLFLWDVRETDTGLMFDVVGGYAVLVENPQDDPAVWAPKRFDLGRNFGSVIASAVFSDGHHVYAVATTSDADQHGYLVRYTHQALSEARIDAEWLSGGAWQPPEAVVQPDVVIEHAHTEGSLHFDAKIQRFVHVTTSGFGGGEAFVRVAEQITGPYVEVGRFKPPESMVDNPFVYAFKGHPELHAGDFDLVMTYATNSFEFADLFAEDGNDLYRPRFARLRFVR